MSSSYRGSTESLRSVRSDAERWLAEQGVMGASSYDCLLILSELSTNAVQAAPGEPFEVDLSFARKDDRAKLVLAVTSHRGNGASDGLGVTEDWVFPESSSPKGRGLAIVRALADDAVVRTSGDRLTVAASVTMPVSDTVRRFADPG